VNNRKIGTIFCCVMSAIWCLFYLILRTDVHLVISSMFLCAGAIVASMEERK
jgi:hypothetical protein